MTAVPKLCTVSDTFVPNASLFHESANNNNIINNSNRVISNSIVNQQNIHNTAYKFKNTVTSSAAHSSKLIYQSPVKQTERMTQVSTMINNTNTSATMLSNNSSNNSGPTSTAGSGTANNVSTGVMNNTSMPITSSSSSSSTSVIAMQSSPGNYASASLYVGDLHPDVTEAMLYEIFNSVGPVASIRVCRDAVTRRSLGYAYVNYHAIPEAERALDTLNYTTIKGIAARIMWSHRDPSLRKSGAGNIFVKNLDKSIDNKALYDTFSLFGNILSCKVKTDEQGKSLGFGFVHYESDDSAKTAIEKVNGMSIGGKTVYVGTFLKRTERMPNTEQRYTNVYIKNIPQSWTEEKLKEVFGNFGEVTSMALRTDNKSRKFAFINFAESDDARKAVIQLNKKIVTDDGVKDEENDEDRIEENGKKDEKNGEKDEVNRLFVGPHQTKTQRIAMLKAKYETINNENKAKAQGVNLYIKNLDDSIDDNGLREMFEQFGPVSSAKIMRDEKAISRGFGFVCFLRPDDATKAVTEMHLKLHNRKPLYVGLAEKRDQRLARMQQRYRFVPPNMRGGNVAGVNSAAVGMATGGIPPQLQFGAPPPHMYFGAGGTTGATPGNAQMPPPPGRGGPVMAYQQGGMMPWRSQAPNPYGGAGGIPQQGGGGGLRQQMNLMGMYAQTPVMHQIAGGGGHHPNSQMGGHIMGGGRGGAGQRGGNMGHGGSAGGMTNGSKQMGGVQPNMNKNMHMGGGGDGGAAFKFTAQARNRIEPNHNHSQGLQQGINTTMHSHIQSQSCDIPVNAIVNTDAPLTAATLAAVGASQQKQYIGEKLFPLIARFEPQLAGKITGMMLEMDNAELIGLIDSPIQLRGKVDEALRVLQQANEH